MPVSYTHLDVYKRQGKKMADIVKKPVEITVAILRDAHQSLIATRMTTEQTLPIVDKMDKVGYHSVECWGCLLYTSRCV